MRIILILLLLSSVAYAGDLRNPNATEDTAVFDYLLHVRDNFNNLPVVTTDPDGSQPGRVGDMVLFSNGGEFRLEICVVASGSSWLGVKLQ